MFTFTSRFRRIYKTIFTISHPQRQHISPMVYAILNKTPEQIKHEKMLQKQQQAIQEAKERKLKAKVEWDKKVEKERQRQFGAKKTGRSVRSLGPK